MELEVKGRGALAVCDCAAVVEVDVLCEARLESCVTDAYVERVGVGNCVGNHVQHIWPACIGVVAELELLLATELILEVHDRRGVDDCSPQQGVDAPFLIIHLADLRSQVRPDGQAVFGAVHAQLQADVVVLPCVARIAALLLVLYDVRRVEELVVVVGVDAQQVVVRVEDGAHVAVVVAEVEAVVVGELQESLICDGFAVAEACGEVVAVVRAAVVLHLMIDGVAAVKRVDEVVVRLRVVVALVVRVAVAAAQVERNVSSGFLQALVDLQGGRGVDVLRTVPAGARAGEIL